MKLLLPDFYRLLEAIPALHHDIVIDDRTTYTIGKRLMEAKLTGYPYIIVIGKDALKSTPLYELFDLNNEKRYLMPKFSLLQFLLRETEILSDSQAKIAYIQNASAQQPSTDSWLWYKRKIKCCWFLLPGFLNLLNRGECGTGLIDFFTALKQQRYEERLNTYQFYKLYFTFISSAKKYFRFVDVNCGLISVILSNKRNLVASFLHSFGVGSITSGLTMFSGVGNKSVCYDEKVLNEELNAKSGRVYFYKFSAKPKQTAGT